MISKRQELRKEQLQIQKKAQEEQLRIQKEIEELDRKAQQKYEIDCEIVKEKLKNIIKIDKNETKNQKISNVKNTIITAPTQVGKTNSIIELCKSCEGWLSVISCDNKADQLKQLLNRVRGEEINSYSLGNATRNMKKIISHITNKENVVIVLLNNETQIYKLTGFLERVQMKIAIKKYICIHDESDMVNKSDDIKNVSNVKIPKSHREWIRHFQIMKGLVRSIRRIWVTATAENCSMLFDIKAKDIIVLPTPENYRPINNHVAWAGTNRELYQEIERIRQTKSGVVILYCSERLVRDQLTLAETTSNQNNCITVAYNSKGTVIFSKNRQFKTDHSIDTILSILKSKKQDIPVVVFGCDLMNRGLSFVGKGSNPYTATVMFYKGGLTTHVIGIVQKFGRITGSARPDLEDRKIYCSQEIYDDYSNYLENQQAIYNALEQNKELNMNQILKVVNSKSLNRNVDRPALRKVNKEYKSSSETSEYSPIETNETEMDQDKMKRLVNSWSNADTDVATLFREMIKRGGAMINIQVREMVKNRNDTYYNNLTNNPHSSKWHTVFRKDETKHYIRQQAIDYFRQV